MDASENGERSESLVSEVKQFEEVIQKLDWIGGLLESLVQQTRDNSAYPRDVRVVENRARY